MMKRIVLFSVSVSGDFGTGVCVMAEEPLFKGYDVLVVKNLEVTSNTPAPESSGSQIAEKVVFQVRRYSQKYKLFEAIVKEGAKDAPEGEEDPHPSRDGQRIYPADRGEAYWSVFYSWRGIYWLVQPLLPTISLLIRKAGR